MKKIFTTLAAAMSALALMATTYTGQLTVTVNGDATTLNNVSIDITNSGDTYSLAINNFMLGEEMAIGNIFVDNLKSSTADGKTFLGVSREILITEGDLPGIESWFGPLLGYVPINMVATINGDYLVTDIDIDMTALEQVIHVNFTNDINGTYRKQFQMPNSDFEEWTEKTAEPRHWHGFNSGRNAGSVIFVGDLLPISQRATLESSTEVRPGSKGAKSALIQSSYYAVSVVNGTMTNGLLQAGSATASNVKNHSEMSPNLTERDKNGDKYFMALEKEPDAITAWIKFKQYESNTKYPYATISALAYDTNIDPYIQDPEDTKSSNYSSTLKTYKNVAARAKNNTIKENGGNWQEITIPFDYNTYNSNNAVANAILVTVSTNAEPGKGGNNSQSTHDKVYVDDMELIYNASITNVELNGITLDGFAFDAQTKHNDLYYERELNISPENFVVTLNGRSAVAAVCINDLGDGNYQVAICATSPDMVNNDLYTINLIKVTPVATILSNGTQANYLAKEDMKIVEALGNIGYATDGTSWMRLNFENAISKDAVIGHIKGQFNGNALAPAIDVTSYENSTATVSATTRTIDLSHSFDMPAASEVATFVGYYENGGTLRGWAGAGQSLTLDGSLGGYDLDNLMQAGQQYKLTAAVELKEAWSGAPARRAPQATDYDYDFQNLTGVVLGSPEELLPTAVENVEAASEVKSVRYIDAMGRVHNAPVDGINIVVTEMANGTTTTVKVVR